MGRVPRAAGTCRFISGMALAAACFALAVTARPQPTSAGQAPVGELVFSNASGVQRTLSTAGSIDFDNPFFKDLGTNGRTCATCHRPAQAWTITPAEIQERFDRTAGLEAIFRAIDATTCADSDISTLDARRRAFSLLLAKGLIRVDLEVPPGAEFEVLAVDDPYGCGAPMTSVSMFRRPLPSTNLAFLSTVMWDGRETAPGQSIRDDLVAQALIATIGHAQGAVPTSEQLQSIVDFELGLFTAQTHDQSGGSLTAAGARGGPGALAEQPFCIGVNDPLDILPAVPGACDTSSGGLDPNVFRLFDAWIASSSPERRAIARGEAIFNTRQFVIADVPGLNGALDEPVQGPIQSGTCTVCHNTPGAGNHSISMPLNIGIADVSRRTPDLPLYTLRRLATGELLQTTDPGRAMVTGRWSDVGKFKGPVLRALAARAPYFHDGSAATLADVVAFYETRFGMQLTDKERADLLAFLRSL